MGDGDTDELERTMALVARGVQRMADSFGAVEARLGELDRLQGIADRIERLESTIAAPPPPTESADVQRLVEAVRGLRDDLATSTTQLEARIAAVPAPAEAPPAPAVDADRLVDAVRALRDDLAAATVQLQAETTATVERAATEQGNRLAQLRDAIVAVRDAIPTSGGPGSLDAVAPVSADEDGEVRALVAEVRDALQALHGEIVAGSGQLRTDLAAEQAVLRDRLVEAVAGMPPPGDDRLAAIEAAVAGLREDLVPRPAVAVHADAASRPSAPAVDDDRVAVAIESLRADVVAAMDRAPGAPGDDRLGAIEHAIAAAVDTIRADIAAATAPIDEADPLEPKLAAIEVSMRAMGGELERIGGHTSDLRTDVRRSFDRVLTSISAAEESVKGEVRAVDQRLGGMADDLRLVRGLRDGLEALAGGVDAVRQLASKSATNQQMAELGRDLTTVLAEIESARSQVLSVDQHVSQPDAIDVRPAIQRLERAVGEDVEGLGKRIEQLAATVEAQAQQPSADPLPPDVTEAVAHRLRSLATGARQLGLGISEDLRSRRGKRSKR